MKTRKQIRTKVGGRTVARPSKPWLDVAEDLTVWAITTIAVSLGVLCLSRGGSGITYGVAFIGLGLCVCPAIKMHWSLRATIFAICVALLS